MVNRPLTPFIALTAVVLGGLSVAGCGGGNSFGPGGNTTSQVRSFNGLQGCSSPVDFAQIGVQPAQFISGYGSPPAGYAAIRSGNGLHYAVFPHGATTNALATADIDLSPHDNGGSPSNGTYTLVATGACGTSVGAAAPRLVRLIDDWPSNFTGTQNGTVALRVINLVPDVGNITLASNGLPLQGNDNTGTNNVEYAGNSGFVSTHYNANINLIGNPTLTVRTNANAVLATVPANFNFAPNHSYTLFVIGEGNPVNGGQPITVVPVQDF
jgi:hypothetical protein